MTDYNSDELCAPIWMSDEFFEKVLKKCENNDSIKVTEVILTPATLKGDHFASVMFRATVSYDTSESKGNCKPMIIKIMPEDEGAKKDMVSESHIFETEIGIYADTIPKFEAELRRVGDNTVLGPKCLYHSIEPKKLIILEDLVPMGYTTIRNRFANNVECKAALLKLAKWHAVSYKLSAEGDKSVTSYKETFMNMKGTESMPLLTSGMENLIDKLETIEELRMFIPKLRSIQKDIIKQCVDSFNTCRQLAPTGIFVLCHGDFHSKNMMFKSNDKGELEDVMLIDFQVSFFGPAVMDLLYAKYMLLNKEARKENFDELIHYYCTNFTETLKNLKFQGEIPTVAEFMIELIKHKHWDIFLLVSFLPVFYGIQVEKIEGEETEYMTSNAVRRKMYDNPNYLEELKRFLPIMMHRGYLEN